MDETDNDIKANIKLKVKSCLRLSLNVFDLIDHHQTLMMIN